MQAIKIKYNGVKTKDNWQHFSWTVVSKGVEINYSTGVGHCTKLKDAKPKDKKIILGELNSQSVRIYVPKLRDILCSMASDAQCAQDSFEDFCSNLGYDTDSRKALETYLACQESGRKLRLILKSKNAIERINDWGL